jgi:CRP-like cAMP-binding protein
MQRQVINNAFQFHIIEPNSLLVEEGKQAECLYIILRGMIDVRQRLPAKQKLRGITGNQMQHSAP